MVGKIIKQRGGNGAVRAPEIHIFLTSRLSGSIFGPRPPLDAQSNENGAQMIPKLINNGHQMTYIYYKNEDMETN